MSSKAKQYQKKTPREHVLLRPDTYIGDVEETTEELWISDDDGIKKEKITYVPGFLKTFDELLVNARDASVNDKTCNTLKIDYDIEKGCISIWNNGQDGIPVEEHPEHKTLVPTMIFGELLTSSNYDDSKKRTVGGRNGYGAKLTNIYSTKFILETVDKKRKLKYTQVFENNMDIKREPEIIKYNDKPYTKITFTPDYQRFNCEELSDDLCALIKKRTYDMVACSAGKIKVSYNNNPSIINDFNDYISLYIA